MWLKFSFQICPYFEFPLGNRVIVSFEMHLQGSFSLKYNTKCYEECESDYNVNAFCGFIVLKKR